MSRCPELRPFLAELEERGDLRRIAAEVDPHLEISGIVQRLMARAGDGFDTPALLFENVKGSDMPLLINLFGSHARMAAALGVADVEEVAARLEKMIGDGPPEGIIEKLKALPKLKEMAAMSPRTVKRAPCKQVTSKGDDVDLGIIPVLTTWPEDAGPFITMPLVATKDPETGRRNFGMYRLQVFDRNTTGMHWHLHKDGKRHFEKTGEAGGRRMEAAVALSCDPVVAFTGCLPAPPDMDEMWLAGWLRGKPVDLVKCETVDLEVPASAEIVLEGWVDIDERRTEGPFGDHTGFYSLADEYPVFHVECVTHRRDAIYQTIVVGRSPQEDCWMATAIERIFLPLMKKMIPGLVDVHMPWEGVFHNLMVVSIKKSHPGHASQAMNAIWGMGQAMMTKVIVVVDHDVDVHDPKEWAWVALCSIDPERDTQFTKGPVETLDHASRAFCYGSKMGIDATTKGPDEGFERPWPGRMVHTASTEALVDARWDEYAIDDGD